jgi:tRNA(Ile)-lysidine synthase TilS/MesJ
MAPTSHVPLPRICSNCVLPSAVPSSRIDDSGLCIYCRQFKGGEDLDKRRREYRERFQRLVEETRGRRNGAHEILVAYSGGKDSTFTLDLLKNGYGLRVLAVTFDHGFVSPYAVENIRRVVEALGVDHMTIKPDFQLLCRVFRFSLENDFHPPKALERASAICNSCMGLVKFLTLRTAMEKAIPLIAYGWSPGQAPLQSAVFRNHASFVRKAQDLFLGPLENGVGPGVRAFFLEERHLGGEAMPYNVNPLAFLGYREEEIYGRIRELGWRPPQDTDPNSTNCLLNALANQAHLRRYGFHPYAMEMAELVREGIVERAEALRRLREPADARVVEEVRRRLGV